LAQAAVVCGGPTAGPHPDYDRVAARQLALHLIESLDIDEFPPGDLEPAGLRRSPRVGPPVVPLVVRAVGDDHGPSLEKVEGSESSVPASQSAPGPRITS